MPTAPATPVAGRGGKPIQAIPHFLFSPHDLKTFVGLYLGINPFRAPPGAMGQAENIVISSQGVPEPRPGLKETARPTIPINAFGYKADEKKMLAAAYDSPSLPPLLDVSLGRRTRFSVYDYAGDTWNQAAMLPGNLPFDRPAPGVPSHFMSANNALYLQGKYGLLKMEKAGTPLSTLNQIQESVKFNTSPWVTVDGVTVTEFNATGPDGNLAAKLQSVANTSSHRLRHAVTLVPGKSYCLTVFAKAGTVQWFGIGNNSNSWAVFDLTNGLVVQVGAGATAAIHRVSTPYSSGWYRCVVNLTVVTGTVVQFILAAAQADVVAAFNAGTSFAAAGTETVFIYGAQFEDLGAYSPAPVVHTTGGTAQRGSPTLRPAMLVKPWSQPVGSAWAGIRPALDASGGWLAVGQQVAYRFTVARFGANNELIESEPSDRIIVANNSGQAMGVTHTIDAHPMYPRDAFLRCWRSAQVPVASDPSDECFLVSEVQLPAPTPLGANGYIDTGTQRTTTLTDLTPDSALFVPLYTNPSTGEGSGLLGANNTAPAARDMAYFKSRAYYCGTRDVHRLLIKVIGTGAQGVTNGSSITVDGATFTFAATDTAAMGPQVFLAGTVAQNLENTARALVAHINHYFAGRTGVFQGGLSSSVYASYISVNATGAGQILLQRLVPGGSPIQVTTSSRNGWDRDYTTVRLSDDNYQVAGLSWSKVSQPEAVPILNSGVVGDAAMDCLRVIALREALFLFKRDGLYKVTDDGTGPSVVLLDPTIKLIAPETAVAIDNVIICLAESGVVLVSEGSGAINISDDQIGRPLRALVLSAGVAALSSLSYAVAYQGHRQYLLALPESPTATACTTYYTYNLQTQTWTTQALPLPTVAGRAQFDQNVLYFAPPVAAGDSFRGFLVERNAGTGDDYQDVSGALRCPVTTVTDTMVFSGDLTKPVYANPNLVLDSQDRFAGTTWVATAAVLTDSVTSRGLAPDGSTRLSTLADTAANSQHDVSQNVTLEPGQTYTLSAHLKAGTLGFASLIVLVNGVALYAVVNLSTGAVLASSGGTGASVSLGNGWYRFTLAFVPSAAVAQTFSHAIRVGTTQANATPGATYVGSGQDALLWGVQIERAGAASAYVATPTRPSPLVPGDVIQQFQATKALTQTVTAVTFSSATGLTTVVLDAAPASAWTNTDDLTVRKAVISRWRMLPQHADHPLTAKVWREAYLSFRYLDLDRISVDWQSESFQGVVDNPIVEPVASAVLDAAPFRILPFSDANGAFGATVWERQTRDVVLKATLHQEVVNSGQLILGVTMGQAGRRFEMNGFDIVMSGKTERVAR